jgi:hypothetical protein
VEARKTEDIRNRAWAFLLRLLEELEKRLPANIAVFQQLSFFSPAAVLSPKQTRFGQMPFIECVDSEEMGELEEQWRQLRQVNKHASLNLWDLKFCYFSQWLIINLLQFL